MPLKFLGVRNYSGVVVIKDLLAIGSMDGTHGHGEAVLVAQEVLTYLASKLITVGDIPFELSYNHSGKILVRGYYMGVNLTYGYVEGMDAWGTFWRVKLEDGVYTKLT